MLNVVCLKYGVKYSAEYVNKLYRMTLRHLTMPHQFVCFTENSTGIDTNIRILPLPVDDSIKGWWWKTYLFKADHFAPGDINLFFDLDIVIVNNIDKLITFESDQLVGFEDPGKIFSRQSKLNSSVMRWLSGSHSDIWTEYVNNRSRSHSLAGDQDWIWLLHSDRLQFFPDSWIKSYKWQVRDRSELHRVGGVQQFKTVRDPELNMETSILVFHGTPNPEHVQDSIIIDNWR